MYMVNNVRYECFCDFVVIGFFLLFSSFIFERIDVKEGDRVTEHIYLCKVT